MACCLGGQVGDASASQSPLSFGGFGTMLRHLPRLAAGVDSALGADALSQRALAVLQARPDLELFTQCLIYLFQPSFEPLHVFEMRVTDCLAVRYR